MAVTVRVTLPTKATRQELTDVHWTIMRVAKVELSQVLTGWVRNGVAVPSIIYSWKMTCLMVVLGPEAIWRMGSQAINAC